MTQTSQNLIDFIKKSPSTYHVIDNFQKMLEDADFYQLSEGEIWHLEAGKSYYVTRNNSSIIAFKIPENNFSGFLISAAHSDSPTFKIKENPEISKGFYTSLNVEKYGGMIMSTWFDKPLSIAGKVVVKAGNMLSTKLVNLDKDLVLIPNLAIHMNRQVNDGVKLNPQVDMLPLFGDETAKGKFLAQVADNIGVCQEQILGMDLFLYNRQAGTIWGVDEEYFSSPKLDNLQCSYGLMTAFEATAATSNVNLCCIFDNEEVGSLSKQGANSTFLKNTLERISFTLGKNSEEHKILLASSFLVSADNVHAVHPNKSEFADPSNQPKMNNGIVFKLNGNQKYTTDAMSMAFFKNICNEAGVPFQTYHNRSDIEGGSTLGNISNSQVSLNSVDIGLAQLAMHSSYETAGTKDSDWLIQAMKTYYSSSFKEVKSGNYNIE